jgi:hypothetical protein
MGLSKAFKALMRKDPAQQAGSKVPKKKKLTHQDVFELKLKVPFLPLLSPALLPCLHLTHSIAFPPLLCSSLPSLL